MEPTNPFLPNRSSLYEPTVFVGRQDAYSRMNQTFADPNNPHAATFTGQPHIGKSALLWHFKEAFDETYVGVFVSLSQDIAPLTEATLYSALVIFTQQELEARQFLTHWIPAPPDPENVTVEWFASAFLPSVFRSIRPHRRLVYLLDDLPALQASIQNKTASPTLFADLSRLITQHEQLSMVVTLPDEYESQLGAFAPLCDLSQQMRLLPLSPDDIEAGLQYAALTPALPSPMIQAIYHAIGGHPLLLQYVGQALYGLPPAEVPRTPDALPHFLTRILPSSQAFFAAQWERLELNERLVLTALSSLEYQNPLDNITPAQIETWLIETDYPLDETSTREALRSLEYDAIVQQNRNGVRIHAGMFQTWLLQNAQLDAPPRTNPRSLWVWLALVIVLILTLGGVLWWQTETERTPANVPAPAPTVTLEPAESDT